MPKMSTHQYLVDAFARTPGLDGTIHGARRIVQGKHGSRSSLFFSAKNQAFMPVESRLERSVCYRLEADRTVVKYRTQPIEVAYGKTKLFPDICVLDWHGQLRILEIKPEVFTLKPDNLRKADFLRSFLLDVGISYSVVGERYCGTEVEMKNLEMLYNRGGRLPVQSDLLRDLVPRVLRHSGPISMRDAAARIVSAGFAPYYLDAALFHGHLTCNMRIPISPRTIVEQAQ